MKIQSFRLKLIMSAFIIVFSCVAMMMMVWEDAAYIPTSIDKHAPIEYVLIHKGKLLEGQGNEALILHNASEIEQLLGLLSENATELHACSFHWRFWFLRNPGEATVHAHNQDCERYRKYNRKIHTMFNQYFETIHSAPSHFLYNVDVDVRYAPEVIISQFMKKNVYVFFLSGEEQRFPSLRIRAKATVSINNTAEGREQADEQSRKLVIMKLQDVGHTLKNTYQIKKISPPRHTQTGSRKKTVENEYEITVYFDLD